MPTGVLMHSISINNGPLVSYHILVDEDFSDQNKSALEHIAKTIDRNPDYLLTSVIPSMLEDGLLERMYPHSPKHPYQKYKRR